MRRETAIVAAAGLAVVVGARSQPLYTDVTATHLPAGIAGHA